MDMKKRIIRVFPTKTNATPTDELVRIRETPSFFDEADEVHVKDTFEDELADATIRLLDLSTALGIDLEMHVLLKMQYNEGRGYKHGKRY